MANDPNKPHAPGGSLDPKDDLNSAANPKADCPPGQEVNQDAKFPGNVSTGQHSPSFEGFKANVSCEDYEVVDAPFDPGTGGSHNPDGAGLDAGITGLHDPSQDGLDPGAGGSHSPDGAGLDPGLGGSHNPDFDGEDTPGPSKYEASVDFDGEDTPGPNDYDPIFAGADPGIDCSDYQANQDGIDPGTVGGQHNPDPDKLRIPRSVDANNPQHPQIAMGDNGTSNPQHKPNEEGDDPGQLGNEFETDINNRSSTDLTPSPTNPRDHRDNWQSRVKEIDKKIQTQLGNLNPGVSLEGIPTGLNGFDDSEFSFVTRHTSGFGIGAAGSLAGVAGIDLTAKMLVKTGQSLGAQGLAFFGVQQAYLHSLNMSESQVWDPLYFINRATPYIHRTAPVAQSTFVGLIPIIESVDDKPGRHEQRVSQDDGPIANVEDLLNKTPRLNNKIFLDYDTPWSAKHEEKRMIAGPHQQNNLEQRRYTGAKSQDDSLIPRDVIINPGREGFDNIPIVEIALQLRNHYSPEKKYEDSPFIDLNEVVDAIIDGKVPDSIAGEFVTDNKSAGLGENGTERKRLNISTMFEDETVKIGYGKNLPKKPNSARAVGGRAEGSIKGNPLFKSAYSHGILPMSFPGEELDGSYITDKGDLEAPIDDDVAYVPLSFTDMRPLAGNIGNFRTVYFRPVITSLSEDYTPEYQSNSYWGRVDPVMIYGSTKRTINFTFELHASAPEDLEVIYNKLHWLSSLVYPEYDHESIMKSGPVARLRIGDVIRSGQVGLPGVIEALSYDYTDQIWELKKDFKVPRSVIVNCSFTILHDTPIGRNQQGSFGAIGFVDSDGVYQSPSSEAAAFRSAGVFDEGTGTPTNESKFRAVGSKNLVQKTKGSK
jgi:hypothetical protein